MKELEYPFDAEEIIAGKKQLKKELLKQDRPFVEKKIAILGVVTTKNIRIILELFLLNYGIKPFFYESEYDQYYEEAVFSSPQLENFGPDMIYVCTSVRNIMDFPNLSDSLEMVNEKLSAQYHKFQEIWSCLTERFHCPVIQNNFEYPYFRLLGNKDASDMHGRDRKSVV